MANALCPSCGKKQFNPSSRRCYACGAEQRPDRTMVKVPLGYHLDPHGNLRSKTFTEIKDGKLLISYHYLLEPGKTTLRDEHPKLAKEPQCVHPERLSCNHGEGFERCEFMAYEGGNWKCSAPLNLVGR